MWEVVCMYLRFVCACDLHISLYSTLHFGEALVNRNLIQREEETV